VGDFGRFYTADLENDLHGRTLATNPMGQLEAGAVRHLNVAKNDVDAIVGLQYLDRFIAVAGLDDPAAAVAQVLRGRRTIWPMRKR